MPKFFARLVTVALILATASCGGGGPDFVWFRAMHAMPDAPALRAYYDDYVFRRTLDFGQVSNEVGDSLVEGAGSVAHLTVEYLGLGNQADGTLLTGDVPVAKDSVSTIILAGSFDEPRLLTVLSPRRQRPLAALYFQFAHAAPALGPLDVYVTAPDTALSATAPFASVQPMAHSSSVQVPFGKTRIRLTHAGTLDVVFDSGERDFPESEGGTGPGAEWLFAIAPSVMAGPSPVSLIGSSSRATFSMFDAGTTPTLRVVHAAADIGPVDVYSVEIEFDQDSGDASRGAETLLYNGLAYPERSPQVPAQAGTVDIDFRISGEAGEGQDPVGTRRVALAAGIEYAFFLFGTSDQVRMAHTSTDVRSVATLAKIRLANLAPDSEFFTFYLTDSEDQDYKTGSMLGRDIALGNITGHLLRRPGEYYLTLTERFYETPSGAADAEETVTIGPIPFALAGGEVVTLAIFPPEAEGGPEQLQIFDDLAP
jgi:hypothetical protein